MLLYAYVAFAILQASLAVPATRPAPKTPPPLGELGAVLPLRELQALKSDHLKSDPGFQAAVKYFKSPEWVSMIEDLRKTPEWLQYKKLVKEAGVDLDPAIRHMEHCLNATDAAALKVEGARPSLASFLEDVKMTHGIQIMKGMHQYLEKVGKTEAYKKFMEEMTGAKSKILLEDALKQPAMQKVIKKLQEMDLNVENVLQVLYVFNGWQPLDG